MVGNEIELKFEVPPLELQGLKNGRALYRQRPAEQNLVSVCFDTPKHKLARNGISLGGRSSGKKPLQTVKSHGADIRRACAKLKGLR
jgi:inorganic triphosphatase YgiF